MDETRLKCPFCGAPREKTIFKIGKRQAVLYLYTCNCIANTEQNKNKLQDYKILKKNYKNANLPKFTKGTRLYKNFKDNKTLLDCAVNKKNYLFVCKNSIKTTKAACAIAKEFLKNKKTCLYLTVTNALNLLQSTYAPNSKKNIFEILQSWETADLLIFDGLGEEKMTPKRLENILLILDTFTQADKKFIICTTPQNLINLRENNKTQEILKRLKPLQKLPFYTAANYKQV